ncbi:NAD-dependent epimerase/dehydratase family protein [Vagococcus carniphilus]|uniref:NAD-dependent epimerase/dehydratase family protein n=1 Tax=Vagococcus carniphilus TaxID=218144 RepID=UPI00288F00EB|nr:NAD-dependent epimerase/dehydratase family protein [Vagococcus carniphilus]MDT2814552.1 NAD-dependent epimerase/dehydratase family protein [Vagococcus carniphilus]MDT2864173.1 NAD-dependent epimerase/dehydratase family protein [Vagococcus carniphilus]
MRKILVTGGTVFVSRSLAEYFVAKGDEVYVLNRNHKKQSEGVKLIEADRYKLGTVLSDYQFDVVIDANAYTAEEVNFLLEALPEIKDYVFISTSAVYPEHLSQPFKEIQKVGPNSYWKDYGTNKIEAEELIAKKVPQGYVLRPAYIYGPYNNAYREAFIFDCAKANRPFYLPQSSDMKVQFIHIHDLCRLVDELLDKKPEEKIYNVGNESSVTIEEWVSMCYEVANESLELIKVDESVNQTSYFSFPNYEYLLDVERQTALIGETIDLKKGLEESFEWYQTNENLVNKRNYIEFIEKKIKGE